MANVLKRANHAEERKLKRQRGGGPAQNYPVGWVCPLDEELIAALEMLDEEHAPLAQPSTDHNVYHLAENNPATAVVTQMRLRYPNLHFALLVGIGGGVPTITEQGMLRLGLVVVSQPVEHFQERFSINMGRRRMRARSDKDHIMENVQRIDTSKPQLRRFEFPGIENDKLFPADYKHPCPGLSYEESGCDTAHSIKREIGELDELIVVHRGTVASGELVLKDSALRDKLAKEYGALCFEREAAGAMTARWVNRILTHHLYTLALSHIGKDGKSVLEWAVRKERMATAKRILHCSPPDYLRKALSFASSTGREDVVRFLLVSSAYTYSQKPLVENNSPLMAASAGGHSRIVQLLLESGENVNTRNSGYYTSLHLAAREGHMNVVQLLLDYGAKLIAASGMRTPLDDAVLGGNPEIVQLFLDLGPNTKVRVYSRFRGHTSRQRMYMPLFSERSLKHGANAQHVNSDGVTPLHNAAQAAWEPSRQMEMVQLLIKCGASIHATNYDGDTPLHRAAGQGASRQVIQGLIACGADINASNDHGETPLHMAARGGEIEAARALIDGGADITATNSQGETAFRVAVSERQKEIMELLSD
ncbi:hypothetical protein IFM58399_02766 [Aspergillus lentulus]|uniref:Uncharacterized protein n=1 Tax=Aspergillus lentulus TaxID=293939 RepID=A0AAN5YH69_ASPLE|nr:uncharacterized protein IFM58399_02766 [Aspergillus lentulus]KAF4156936.1 hypothetical protein CNMCM6069_006232 [Aspergillus lentulus]KAF4176637.1 hypothetical protein CNMCM8060_006229 [Aspergillus lentulus]KAF4185444.1 hypothetical protein CNMCM7927_006767 [Aspergillus lentulus]KAF4195937.1 hypothetical protein CNMCM8694_005679 [Aspergillus lentulus]KAF4200992.1 hypothetical protein CNMCM8927_002242 [Aspergillus lentulus]